MPAFQAPDFPGFGFTAIPDSRNYEFTAVNILQTLEAFLDALEVTSFAIYLHDYGAPIGMRSVCLLPHPVLISARSNPDMVITLKTGAQAPKGSHGTDCPER